MLKKSRFNYVAKGTSGYLIYNNLYSSLSRMSEEEYAQYKDLKFSTENLQSELEEQGFLVDENINEIGVFNAYSKLNSKRMNPVPSITVTPTMECNARCFYCYEEGVRHGRMKKESAEKIVRFIKALDTSKGVFITWFGGEPLMNQEWMDYFADMLRAEKIKFSAFMISNGSKIDESVIKKMKENWNISSIQITFDGDCEEYIKRKNYLDQNESIFFQMIKKIKALSDAGIAVQIRLNIDKNNVESIYSLVARLQQIFYSDTKISYYPAFLTGKSNFLTEREKVDVIKKIMEIDENKFHINNYLYKKPKSSACYYNQKNAFSIDVSGNVFICERAIGHPQKAIGNIEQNYDFAFAERELSGLRPECQNCPFLPKCHGGCKAAYDENNVPCYIDKYIIKAYLESI